MFDGRGCNKDGGCFIGIGTRIRVMEDCRSPDPSWGDGNYDVESFDECQFLTKLMKCRCMKSNE